MFIGYALYYFTRKSFTFAMPALIQDLGFDKGQLGILGSVLSITYGISKFASGLLGDRANARYFMAYGLVLTGICNIFFGCASSLIWFVAFWGLNGYFQGFGWPSCARLLMHWYSQSERGRWWSFWNTSQNIGGAVIPLLTAFIAQFYGWRLAMILPGIIALFGGLFLINRLRDTPRSLGLPAIEDFRDDHPVSSVNKELDQKDVSVKQVLFNYVLTNPYLWLLALSYFFVYIVRTAINDWTVLYLVEVKGYSQLAAGGAVFWFEIGGIFGSLLAGWASDKVFKGARGQTNVLFSIFVFLVTFALWKSPGHNLFLDSTLVFLLGFFVFGPQMLIGMAAAELAHKKAAVSSNGFVCWFGYIGAAVAGYPLGKIAQDFGWEGFFLSLSICGVGSILLLLPLWNVTAVSQKGAKATA